MSLARFCRKPVAIIQPTQSVAEAAEALRDQHVGALVVVQDDLRPVGMLTDRDIVTRVLAARKDATATSVADVMSPRPFVARLEDSIDRTLFALRQHGVRRLPIVDGQGQVVGLVSLDDFWVLLSAELDQTASVVRDNQGP
ncbi:MULTISPECIES: CBS domain-containing protein [unclassified Corallococcus]|uniref:CBS domain-containing protein n=1 Tax=unclassified Corallococcus TaxID=2685029 RepID=UPI001A8EBF20|nr:MULTISPECIES: CBS domain-containing protein [unclassified Corallococcus]MBN9685548.1 CBS domain-containing protein [Corallococcus sp. NCSPR001]WAS83004.1 CBS domain-containing protein [Corallococcus sp. NCRR]